MSELDVNVRGLSGATQERPSHAAYLLLLALGALPACADHERARADASSVGRDGRVASDGATVIDDGAGAREGGAGLPESAANADSAADAGTSRDDAALNGALDFPSAPSRRLAVGTDGVCVIAADHTVQCSDQRAPRDSENHDFVRIAGSGYTLCGIRTDKSMYCWYRTSNSTDQVPPGAGFYDVTDPSNSNCGLGDDGAVHCAPSGLGLNATYPGPYLQFDRPDDREFCAVTPGHSVHCVKVDAAASNLPFGSNVLSVQAVQGGLCVGLIEGGIHCLQNVMGAWTEYGQPVAGKISEFVGSQSLCYVTESGTASCSRFFGVQQLEPPPNVRFVALGISALSACGISEEGEVWCWEDLKQPGGGGKPAYKVPFAKRALVH